MAQTALSNAAALTQEYSDQSTLEFYRMGVLDRLMDTRWGTGLATDITVKIPNPVYNTKLRDRTGPTQDWDSGNESTLDYIDHTLVDTPIEASAIIDYRALRRTPIDYIPRMVEDVRRKSTIRAEDKLVTFMNALAGIRTDAYGTATSAFISPTGDVTGGATARFIRRAITKYQVTMARANVLPALGLSPIGGQVGGMWCAIQPELYSIFADEVLDAKYSLDPATSSLMQDGSLFTNEAFRGFYRGVAIFSTNALATPASAAAGWTFWCGVPQAIAFNKLDGPRLSLEPSTNQKNPVWKVNQITEYAITSVQPELLTKVTIRSN